MICYLRLFMVWFTLCILRSNNFEEEEEANSPKGVPQARTPRHIRRGGSTGSPRLGVPQTRDPQAEEEEANCPKGYPRQKLREFCLCSRPRGAHTPPPGTFGGEGCKDPQRKYIIIVHMSNIVLFV